LIDRPPDGVFRVVDVHVVHQYGGRDRVERPMAVPNPHVSDYERVLLVRTDAIDIRLAERDAAAQVEGVAALAWGFLVPEATERQRADVHLLAAAIGLADG